MRGKNHGTIMGRFLHAVDGIRATQVVPHQLERIKERLRSGVDVDGKAFAPYKYKRSTNQARPLLHAAKLFEGANVGETRGLEESEFRASISGKAAKIARHQNYMRKFLGFSRKDREEIRRNIVSAIKDNMRGSA